MSLKQELGLNSSFSSKEHEAVLNIYHTAMRLKKHATEFFKQHGVTDVQFNVLSLLAREVENNAGLSQVDLGRRLLVNRANITSIVDRMERDELIKRVADPEDRRYNIIKLTPKGAAAYEAAAGDYLAEVNRVMKVLNKGELDALIGVLERVRRIIG